MREGQSCEAQRHDLVSSTFDLVAEWVYGGVGNWLPFQVSREEFRARNQDRILKRGRDGERGKSDFRHIGARPQPLISFCHSPICTRGDGDVAFMTRSKSNHGGHAIWLQGCLCGAVSLSSKFFGEKKFTAVTSFFALSAGNVLDPLKSHCRKLRRRPWSIPSRQVENSCD
jgi:hypothetical protein